MYRCQVCGNTEKFLGVAEEKGSALIYQDHISEENTYKYSWIYNTSDDSWDGKFKLSRCFYCNSKIIRET